jgi:hypothetical protein
MTSRLLTIPPDELCTVEQRARLAELARQGRSLVDEVSGWADAARAAVADLNRGLGPLELADEEYALVSLLTGASDLMAVASDLVDAAERLCAAEAPPGTERVA